MSSFEQVVNQGSFRRTSQNSYSISHYAALWLYTWWLDSDGIVTAVNCRQHDDWAANGSVVTVQPAANNGNYRAHNTKSPRGLCNGFTSGIKPSEFGTILVCRG